MLKKIVLGALALGLIAILTIGAVNRTNSKASERQHPSRASDRSCGQARARRSSSAAVVAAKGAGGRKPARRRCRASLRVGRVVVRAGARAAVGSLTAAYRVKRASVKAAAMVSYRRERPRAGSSSRA